MHLASHQGAHLLHRCVTRVDSYSRAFPLLLFVLLLIDAGRNRGKDRSPWVRRARAFRATDSFPRFGELGVPSSHLKVIDIDAEDDFVLFVVEQALPTKHLLETGLF